MSSGARGLLLVHAHPDDESINNGVTMAACAEAGVPVTLVTCTRGEEGEIIPPALAPLASDRDDTLGTHREGELAAAMAALGVRDHRFLGGGQDGRWRDSGMMGLASNDRPGAFWGAGDDAAHALAEVIRETRPATLITYDPNGGYGHPDHIQAHRVAMRAVELAATADTGGTGGTGGTGEHAPHAVTRVLWNVIPRSVAGPALERLRAAGPGRFGAVAPLDAVPGLVDDADVALAVSGTTRQAAAKAAAMRAHVTQIEVEEAGGTDGTSSPVFALSNELVQPLWTTEYYRLAAGPPPDPDDPGPPFTVVTPSPPASRDTDGAAAAGGADGGDDR